MKNLTLNQESKLVLTKKTIVKLNAAELHNIKGGSYGNAFVTDLGDNDGDMSTGTILQTIRTSIVFGSL